LALPPREWRDHWLALAFMLSYVVGATTLLLLLRQTLGRCKVRSIQVFRVSAYAATPALAVGIVLFITVAIKVQYSGMLWGAWKSNALQLLGLLLIVPVVVCGPYLSLGLAHYLHLPRPWSLGMTAALVGSLFGLVVLQYLGMLQ
jgi:peptidoglycan biosynthesis protein MviN/MurJ (putative lipid II flippase)